MMGKEMRGLVKVAAPVRPKESDEAGSAQESRGNATATFALFGCLDGIALHTNAVRRPSEEAEAEGGCSTRRTGWQRGSCNDCNALSGSSTQPRSAGLAEDVDCTSAAHPWPGPMQWRRGEGDSGALEADGGVRDGDRGESAVRS